MQCVQAEPNSLECSQQMMELERMLGQYQTETVGEVGMMCSKRLNVFWRRYGDRKWMCLQVWASDEEVMK